jgi:protein-tyrosine phosphatase
MISVLFVCLGNICRSPMAEAVFMQLVRDENLQAYIKADSAGTAKWEIDSAPHPGTIGILEENGIEYSGQGRKIQKADLDIFDYIVTMDDENLRDVRKLGKGSAMIAPLMSFVANTEIREIPDPYFDHGFEVVYVLINAGARGLLNHIKTRHNLSQVLR